MVKMYLRWMFLVGFILVQVTASTDQIEAQSPIPLRDSLELENLLVEAKKQVLIDNPDQAVEVLEEGLNKAPQNATIHYELARVLLKQGALPKAFEHIAVAAHTEPYNTWILRLYADISARIGNYPALAEAYHLLAEKTGSPATYIAMESEALARAGSTKKALKRLKKAIKIHPKSKPMLLYTETEVYHLMGDHKREKKALGSLQSLAEKNIQLLHKIASSYSRDHWEEEAQVLYERIYKLNPTDPVAVRYCVSEDLRRGNYSDFFDKSEPFLGSPSVSPKTKVRLLMPAIEALSGKSSPLNDELEMSLEKVAEQLIKMHPEEAVVRALAGDIQQITGSSEAALLEYERALTLNKSVLTVWEQVFRLLLETSEWGKLRERTEDAGKLFPAQSTIPYYRSIALYHLHRLPEAQRQARQAYIMSGRDKERKVLTLMMQSLIQAAQGEEERAGKTLVKVMKIDRTPMAELVQVYLLAHSPATLSSASASLRQTPVLQGCCSRDKPYVAGFIALMEGDFAGAIKRLTPLVDRTEPVAFPRWLLYQWLQKAHEEKGETEKAKFYRDLNGKSVIKSS